MCRFLGMFIFGSLISLDLFAGEFPVKPIKISNYKIPTNLHYLTTGNHYLVDGRSKVLRVSIVIEEIYPNILIEEISLGDVEGDSNVISGSYYLSGFDIADNFNYSKWKWLNGLKFEKWLGVHKFEMSDKRTRFTVTYNAQSNDKIVISALNNK